MQEISNVYAERAAYVVRKMLIEENIITKNMVKFERETLERIVNFFGCEISWMTLDETHIERYKNQENYFFISVSSKDMNVGTFSGNLALCIFHELAHVFFDFQDSKKEEKEEGVRCLHGNKSTDIQADLFARAMIMPPDEFANIAEECVENGAFNVQKIAQKYELRYADVLVRGKELNYWE